jgi:predicted glycosyltransferase
LFSRELAGVALVPNNVIDAVGLLSRASVFVGAGGTMTAEAALMGVPTISCYPGEPTYVDRYLFRVGLAEKVSQISKIASRVRHYLDNEALADRQKKKANKVLSRMEDPIRVIMSHLGLV